MAIATATQNNISALYQQKKQQEEAQQNQQRSADLGGPTFPQPEAPAAPQAPAPSENPEMMSTALEPSKPVDIDPSAVERRPFDAPGGAAPEPAPAQNAKPNWVDKATGFISDATQRATKIAGEVAGAAGQAVESGIEAVTGVEDPLDISNVHKTEAAIKEGYEGNKTDVKLQEGRKTEENMTGKPNMPDNFVERNDSPDMTNLTSDLKNLYNFFKRTRGEGFARNYPDYNTFSKNLEELGLDSREAVKQAVSGFGLSTAEKDSDAAPVEDVDRHGERNVGSGYKQGDTISEQEQSLGDIKRSENPVQPSALNAQNRAIQNDRERGHAGKDVTNMTPVNQNGEVQTDGKVFDSSRKGPANRTAGGAAFNALESELFEAYKGGAAQNSERISEISNYMAVELGIDPLQFPEAQRDAMVNAAVMRHLAQFGDSKQRSIANMLANGENPYYVDDDGNTQVAIPTDGRDGVAPNTGRVAERRFNPNTGMWEVGRAPERRLGDERRAAHTMLSEQMTTGNYPIERYLDSEGNWKEGGIEAFQQDNAIALGIHYDDEGNMIYDGRGARHGQLGLQKELETFRNLMQRSGTFARQREMRGMAQNMASPTLGPQMYAESMAQATSLQEKMEIANRFGDYNMANQISQQLHDDAAVRAAAAGADKNDPTAPEVMAQQNAAVQGALAQGDTAGAYNMLVTGGTPPMAAGQIVGSALVKQRGGKFTPDLVNDAGMNNFLQTVFQEMGGSSYFKNDGNENSLLNMGGWLTGNDTTAKQFTDRVLQMLGAAPTPEAQEAIFQWWHTQNGSTEKGTYGAGTGQDDSLPTPPEQEAPPEEDLTKPPADDKKPPAKPKGSNGKKDQKKKSAAKQKPRRPFDP